MTLPSFGNMHFLWWCPTKLTAGKRHCSPGPPGKRLFAVRVARDGLCRTCAGEPLLQLLRGSQTLHEARCHYWNKARLILQSDRILFRKHLGIFRVLHAHSDSVDAQFDLTDQSHSAPRMAESHGVDGLKPNVAVSEVLQTN